MEFENLVMQNVESETEDFKKEHDEDSSDDEIDPKFKIYPVLGNVKSKEKEINKTGYSRTNASVSNIKYNGRYKETASPGDVDIEQWYNDRNATLASLQRKKVISYTENLQLEREVENLKSQLAILESFDHSHTNNHNNGSSNHTSKLLKVKDKTEIKYPAISISSSSSSSSQNKYNESKYADLLSISNNSNNNNSNNNAYTNDMNEIKIKIDDSNNISSNNNNYNNNNNNNNGIQQSKRRRPPPSTTNTTTNESKYDIMNNAMNNSNMNNSGTNNTDNVILDTTTSSSSSSTSLYPPPHGLPSNSSLGARFKAVYSHHSTRHNNTNTNNNNSQNYHYNNNSNHNSTKENYRRRRRDQHRISTISTSSNMSDNSTFTTTSSTTTTTTLPLFDTQYTTSTTSGGGGGGGGGSSSSSKSHTKIDVYDGNSNTESMKNPYSKSNIATIYPDNTNIHNNNNNNNNSSSTNIIAHPPIEPKYSRSSSSVAVHESPSYDTTHNNTNSTTTHNTNNTMSNTSISLLDSIKSHSIDKSMKPSGIARRPHFHRMNSNSNTNTTTTTTSGSINDTTNSGGLSINGTSSILSNQPLRKSKEEESTTTTTTSPDYIPSIRKQPTKTIHHPPTTNTTNTDTVPILTNVTSSSSSSSSGKHILSNQHIDHSYMPSTQISSRRTSSIIHDTNEASDTKDNENLDTHVSTDMKQHSARRVSYEKSVQSYTQNADNSSSILIAESKVAHGHNSSSSSYDHKHIQDLSKESNDTSRSLNLPQLHRSRSNSETAEMSDNSPLQSHLQLQLQLHDRNNDDVNKSSSTTTTTTTSINLPLVNDILSARRSPLLQGYNTATTQESTVTPSSSSKLPQVSNNNNNNNNNTTSSSSNSNNSSSNRNSLSNDYKDVENQSSKMHKLNLNAILSDTVDIQSTLEMIENTVIHSARVIENRKSILLMKDKHRKPTQRRISSLQKLDTLSDNKEDSNESKVNSSGHRKEISNNLESSYDDDEFESSTDSLKDSHMNKDASSAVTTTTITSSSSEKINNKSNLRISLESKIISNDEKTDNGTTTTTTATITKSDDIMPNNALRKSKDMTSVHSEAKEGDVSKSDDSLEGDNAMMMDSSGTVTSHFLQHPPLYPNVHTTTAPNRRRRPQNITSGGNNGTNNTLKLQSLSQSQQHTTSTHIESMNGDPTDVTDASSDHPISNSHGRKVSIITDAIPKQKMEDKESPPELYLDGESTTTILAKGARYSSPNPHIRLSTTTTTTISTSATNSRNNSVSNRRTTNNSNMMSRSNDELEESMNSTYVSSSKTSKTNNNLKNNASKSRNPSRTHSRNVTPLPSKLLSDSAVSKVHTTKDVVIYDETWTEDIDNKWEEVKFLLRNPIKTESDMHYTIGAAEAGLVFIDELNDVAKSLQILRGTLSRWILPYDHNTRIDEQSSTIHSVITNMPEQFIGKLSDRQIQYLVTSVNSVRKLIRIKIADDNDLEQARSALQCTAQFFQILSDTSKIQSLSSYDILSKHL